MSIIVALAQSKRFDAKVFGDPAKMVLGLSLINSR